ncbi:hypothetical protein [Bradyrhizobium liaoningense]|uniref:hypothetical protein n=1 Tax=Bradyrhizobium liaoningense TaxID=43992 RepID=UPI001BA7434E|nr:hypothetical protein [Bradyrhizobium liaoningense]MBR0822344.1 hypothetical protein [Bradyrhizobium liaoningense]
MPKRDVGDGGATRSIRQVEVQELIEGARPVVTESLATREAMLAVQRQRRLASASFDTSGNTPAEWHHRDEFGSSPRNAAGLFVWRI